MSGFTLSDPHWDFRHPESQEMLHRIVAKQGVGLTGDDLLSVFNGYLPAGKAAECCAYLHALFQLFRTPEDDAASQLWQTILWIWLEQERSELEKLNQHQRIIDELRRIVHDTLIPAPWQPGNGADEICHRASMLLNWMCSPWGQGETEKILNRLRGGDTAQQFILLRIFLEIKNPTCPLGTRKADESAFPTFAEHFETHFRESTALYDAVFRLSELPLPANDATSCTFIVKNTLEECGWYL
jgi:hypothetical protein